MFTNRYACQWQKFYLSFLIILIFAFQCELHFLHHHVHCTSFNTGNKTLSWEVAYDSLTIAHVDNENVGIAATSPYVHEEIESFNRRKDLIKRYNNIMHDVWPFLDLIASLGNSTLDRKVAPSVTIVVDPVDHGILNLACYIHGFYPQNIEVFWLQNGEDITEKMATTDILPNTDNTFSLITYVDAEENNKHKYTCMVKHSSVTNGISATVDFNQGFGIGYYVGGVLALVGIIAGMTGIILRYRLKALRVCMQRRNLGPAETVHRTQPTRQELEQLDGSPDSLHENVFSSSNYEAAYLTIQDIPVIGLTSDIPLDQSTSTTVE